MIKKLLALMPMAEIQRCATYAVLPAIWFYLIAIVLMRRSGFDTMQILRDPAQQSQTSSLLGLVSSVGVWLWVAAAAISFFSLPRVHATWGSRYARMLLAMGGLSILLAIDDFFMIHDRYIDQNICYGFFALYALGFLAYFYNALIHIKAVAFLFTGMLLALSIATDIFQFMLPFSYDKLQVLEEGFKFLGGAMWLYFCCQMGWLTATEVNALNQ